MYSNFSKQQIISIAVQKPSDLMAGDDEVMNAKIFIAKIIDKIDSHNYHAFDLDISNSDLSKYYNDKNRMMHAIGISKSDTDVVSIPNFFDENEDVKNIFTRETKNMVDAIGASQDIIDILTAVYNDFSIASLVDAQEKLNAIIENANTSKSDIQLISFISDKIYVSINTYVQIKLPVASEREFKGEQA